MHVPPWAIPQINFPLHALRRQVVERLVEHKGLTPGTAKFNTVVNRRLDEVKYMDTCKYDKDIPAVDLLKARTPKAPKPTPKKNTPRERGVRLTLERRRSARGRNINSSRG